MAIGAKTKQQPAISLAMSGSGFLAMIHAGAVCAAMDRGVTIAEVAGTSGGSILAAAVAAGLTQQEIRNMALVSDMSNLLKWTPSALFAKRKAWCNGKALYAWLDQHFKGRQLQDSKIPVRLVSTSYLRGESFVFTRSSTPMVSFALACRASAAIPVIYAPVSYRGSMLVDGGILDNCPMDKLVLSNTIKIGVDVDSGGNDYTASSVVKYASGLLSMLLASNEAAQILMAREHGAHLVKVNTPNNFLNNHATPQQRRQMFDQGYEGMQSKLKDVL